MSDQETAAVPQGPIGETPDGYPKRIFPRIIHSTSDSVFWQRIESIPREDAVEDVTIADTDTQAEVHEKLQKLVDRVQEKLAKIERIMSGIKQPFFGELEAAMMEAVYYIDHTAIWQAIAENNQALVSQLWAKREGIMTFFESFGSVSLIYQQKKDQLNQQIAALQNRSDQAATSRELTEG